MSKEEQAEPYFLSVLKAYHCMTRKEYEMWHKAFRLTPAQDADESFERATLLQSKRNDADQAFGAVQAAQWLCRGDSWQPIVEIDIETKEHIKMTHTEAGALVGEMMPIAEDWLYVNHCLTGE